MPHPPLIAAKTCILRGGGKAPTEVERWWRGGGAVIKWQVEEFTKENERSSAYQDGVVM